MPGLDRSIVEHRLPIKPGYRPFKQAPRRFNPNVLDDIKKETERLLEAKFIRPYRYAEWISNVVPMYKKNGKLRVCIDFRDLNKATPMDGYPMPIANCGGNDPGYPQQTTWAMPPGATQPTRRSLAGHGAARRVP